MRKQIILLIVLSFCLTAHAQNEIAETTHLFKMNNMLSKGRFEQALKLLQKRLEKLRIKKDLNSEYSDKYYKVVFEKGMINERAGNFKDAEICFKEILEENTKTDDISQQRSRSETLGSIATLYGKMNNDHAAEPLLEELIVKQYRNLKQAKIDLTVNTYKDTWAPYMEEGVNADSLQTEMALEILANLERENTDKDVSPKERKQELQNKAIARMVNTFQASNAVIPDSTLNIHKGLLKMGKFELHGHRNGLHFDDPWNEVHQLFRIYLSNKNFIAAEALIRGAIALDENTNSANPMAEGLDALYSLTYMDFIKKLIPKRISDINPITNLQNMIGRNETQPAKDIFYIQNKNLLAQFYKMRGDSTRYAASVIDINHLCRNLDNIKNPLIQAKLASVYKEIGSYNEAVNTYSKIIDGFNTERNKQAITSGLYLTALQENAFLYKKIHNYPAAKVMLDKALSFQKRQSKQYGYDYSAKLLSLGKWHYDMNEPLKAAEYSALVLDQVSTWIKENFSFLSEREKSLLLAQQADAFDFSVSLLARYPSLPANFFMKTFMSQSQLKGFVLKDGMRVLTQLKDSGNAKLTTALQNWLKTRSAIAREYSRPADETKAVNLENLKATANEQEKMVNLLSSDFAKLQERKSIDYPQLQQRLKTENAAAIEFVRYKQYSKYLGDTVMYGAFVLTQEMTVPAFIPLCDEQQLEALLRLNGSTYGFIKSLYGNGINPADNTIKGRKSDELYRLIWKPLLKYLKQNEQVLLSPAGLLGQINFNALPFDEKNYLIDKYLISTIYSFPQYLSKNTTYKPANTSAVLFGNISYGAVNAHRKWPALSNASEVSEISIILKQSGIEPLLLSEVNASEQSFKSMSGRSPRILHMATHGYFKQGSSDLAAADPMLRGGLVLANANSLWNAGITDQEAEDGIVTAYEIAGLDLSNTELAVLSACETALGDIEGNEGVYGLQRGLRSSGVRNLVLGLWSLPDTETSSMMKGFYAEMNNKKDNLMSYSEPLNITQKKLRKEKPPYYWAGLLLIQ